MTTSTRPGWVRWAVLLVGCVLGAVAAYVAAQAVYVLAVLVDAAPLLAGDTTRQQPWVLPIALVVGTAVLGLCLRRSLRGFRRRR